jgi:high affinity Mn2+ porin
MNSLPNALSTTSSQAYWVAHPLDDHSESRRDSLAPVPMPRTPRVRLLWRSSLLIVGLTCLFCLTVSFNGAAQESLQSESSADGEMQTWNWHVQNTDIEQGDWGFPARHSGPNSLKSKGQQQETVTLGLVCRRAVMARRRGPRGRIDVAGFGLSKTFGIEAFPNSDAYKLGTEIPYLMFAHLFIRQTIGLGGEHEAVPDNMLTLAGEQDISRLTFTIGKFTPLDIFDHNTYAQDPHTQFMNWALVGNLAWDYPADSVGYTTGVAAELNQPKWSLRYGFYQMADVANSLTGDDRFLLWRPNGGIVPPATYGPFLHDWGMMVEFERRYSVNAHPGAIRFMPWLNEARMASNHAATAILLANGPGADISPAQGYRYRYGFGLNWEQEVAKDAGMFSRLDWNDGREQACVHGR